TLEPSPVLVYSILISLQFFVFAQEGLERFENLVVDWIIAGGQAMAVIACGINLELCLTGDLPGNKRSRKMKDRFNPNALILELARWELDEYVGLNAAAAVHRSTGVRPFFITLLRHGI